MTDTPSNDDGATETAPLRRVVAPAPGGPNTASRRAIPVVEARRLVKTYDLGATTVQALRGVSLTVERGEFLAVMGPSGSGKSTFMHLLGLLDRPTSGDYHLIGAPVQDMTPNELAAVRNQRIGFIFQGFNLLARLNALENVELPMVYAGLSAQDQRRRAQRALELVGLGDRLRHYPNQLSGGQQQRVAIARALVNNPALLLADEPTGNLDSQTSVEIMAILQVLNTRGVTIVLVTHEADIASYTHRQVGFRDGHIVSDTPSAAPRSAASELASRRAKAG
jgi:putative ABC transport system ATP-binding protein